MDFEGLILLHTALDAYKLNIEVPETVITGDTANIITIASNGWYEWIKFYDSVGNTFPEDKYDLGRYLRSSIDIGLALTERSSTDPPISHSLHRS